MRCELCNDEMAEDKMVASGEFFVCEDCADLEAAADKLTSADIETAMRDIARHSVAITKTEHDGTVTRIDPVEFRKTDAP